MGYVWVHMLVSSIRDSKVVPIDQIANTLVFKGSEVSESHSLEFFGKPIYPLIVRIGVVAKSCNVFIVGFGLNRKISIVKDNKSLHSAIQRTLIINAKQIPVINVAWVSGHRER